jgi:hypothetical protein
MADENASSTGGRPEPHPLHVAHAEKQEQERQAINYVMTRDNVDYPTAAKTVKSIGAESLLKQREGTDTKAHERSVAAAALANRLKIPGETSKFLLELNDRVAALEAASAPKSDEPAA